MQNKLFRHIGRATSDRAFLHYAEFFETLIAKILLVVIILITIYAVVDLAINLSQIVLTNQIGSLGKTLISIFGLFLNILIALELLENIAGYLRKHVFQVELVIVTAIIAVARKIVILDLEKTSGLDLIGLATAIIALTIGYYIIRISNQIRNS
ncbi:MAG: phosphate-starvation-inducible PsiE family protein [Alkalinema sp. RU_4_3]|nr:phosphate-starvation-inducible PsiE family protein [Alkalinema sp. RU_4_3]